MKLNSEQQCAVSVEKNAVVTAGAGSGKTTVLALRFLRLIREERAKVDEILTLTFTRKAAAEMYERIYRLLGEHQGERVVADQLSRFDTAQISTLDSFCVEIVRGGGTPYGVPAGFLLDASGGAAEIQTIAMEFLLQKKNHPAMQRMLELFGVNRVLEEFWVPFGMDGVELSRTIDYKALSEKQLTVATRECDEAVSSICEAMAELVALPAESSKVVAALQEREPILEKMRECLQEREWGGLADAFTELTVGVRTPGSVKKEAAIRAKELFTDLKDSCNSGADFCAVLYSSGYVTGLAELAMEYAVLIRNYRLASGSLTFKDVMELAVEILKRDQRLRSYYKRKFRYIMIDEFQDNNRLQKELLYLLAERPDSSCEGVPSYSQLAPDKLFLVGDDKQSIYRFRGADVSVFKAIQKEFAEGKGEIIHLNSNYRSSSRLVSFFNDLFNVVMGDASAPFEAEYRTMVASEEKASGSSTIQFLIGLPGENLGGVSGEDGTLPAKQREALAVGKFIAEAVRNQTLTVEEDGRARAATYDDFAVLLRTTGNQGNYERYFRILGIPYDTREARSFFLEAPVNDIYSLLQIVVFPTDTIAYAALLRSPLIELSDDAISQLLKENLPPFDQGGEATMARKSDCEKFRKGGKLYSWCLDAVDRLTLPQLLEEIWYSWGYRYTLLRNPMYHSFLDYYDYLWSLALEIEQEGTSLVGFLERLRGNLGSFERLGELPVQKGVRRGVRIMSIHAAKGLEFPITIAGDAASSIRRGARDGRLYYMTPELGITVKLGDGEARELVNPFYEEAKAKWVEEEAAELKRLLYVAATRAENHLLIAGAMDRGKGFPGGSLLELLSWGFDSPDFESLVGNVAIRQHLTIIEPYIKDYLSKEQQALKSRRFVHDAIALYDTLPQTEYSYPPREVGTTDYTDQQSPTSDSSQQPAGYSARRIYQFDTTGTEGRHLPPLAIDPLMVDAENAKEFGSLCHHFIQDRIGEPLPARWKEKFFSSFSPEHRIALFKVAEELSGGFVASQFWRDVPRPSTIDSEFSFLAVSPAGRGLILKGRMDLIIQFEQEVWIVDFKTDSSVVPERHLNQLSTYCNIATEITGKNATGFLYYLRDGSIVSLRERSNSG